MSDYYLHLRDRTQRIIEANANRLSAATLEKLGKPVPITVPRPVLNVRPIFDKGRYIPKSLDAIISTVAKMADTDPKAICGESKRRNLVNARCCIANLAEEFASHQSEAAVDDAMLRGHGMTGWYRERHADRLALFPCYADLHQRAHAELSK